MSQDRHQRAKERYSDAVEAVREQYERIKEDLRFSNPAKPQQWSSEAVALRGSRPMLTFNHCQKFIRQVANDGRGNVPSIQVSPADAYAHAKAAEVISGRLRHIEYVSKAKVAYTTALRLAADCGLGWIRVIPEVINPETNQQEPRILRVHDPLSCVLDPDSTEPDGCDAEWGFVLSPMTTGKFKRAYPKANATHSWQDEGNLWTHGDTVLVCEYFEIERKKSNRIVIETPDGDTIALGEGDYWDLARELGVKPPVVSTFEAEEKSVKWSKMTGAEELEVTDFPSRYIPIVPVIGDEVWVDGKRYLCGLTRQLMDGQRMHNAEMSSMTESILSQPKAPFAVAARAIEGHEAAWQKLNVGNPVFLPYNDVDDSGNAVAPPQRLSPPQFPGAYANGATLAMSEMEGAVGMYKASFGQQSNAVSGRAKLADRRESDTGTYHYHDNLARAVEHVGRIVFEMDRALTDTDRTVRTMSEDGKFASARYEPQMAQSVRLRNGEVEAVNPRIGEYDMRVKVGPTFVTQAEETAAELSEMFRSAPQLLPVLGPTWVKMKGIPGAEKLAKLMLSLAPPEVQKIEAEDGKEEPIPPQAKLQMQQMEAQIKELSQALEAAADAADKTTVEREKNEADIRLRAYQAVTDRLKLAPAMSPQDVIALVQQTVEQALVIPPVEEEISEVPQEAPEPVDQPIAPMQPMQDMGEPVPMSPQEGIPQ
jgi:hypothetical protein